MGKRIIEELATDTIQDNDFILMDNNTTPTDPDDDTAGTRKIRASEFGAQIIPVDDELSTSSENPVQNKVITGAINDLASATEITGTASGSIASFDDGSANPIKELTAQITAVQSGSGDPSPENVRPISGWDGANVNVSGVNLFGGKPLADNVKSNLPAAVIDTTAQTVSYGYSASSANAPVVNGVPFKANTQYTFILSVLNPTTNRTNLNILYTDGTTTVIGMTKTNEKEVVVVTSNASKTVQALGLQRQGGTTVLYYNECGIFEGVLTADDYEPYNGTTYPISWQTQSGTVYGGNFKLFKDGGKWYCTVTKTHEKVDLGTLSWVALSSGNNVFYAPITGTVNNTGSGNTPNITCECYKKTSAKTATAWASTTEDSVVSLGYDTARAYVRDSNYNDADTFGNSVDGKYLVYPLATPETYTFEIDTEIATLLGVNNVSVDTGDILDATYVRNANITINDLIRRIENLEG